MGICPTCGVRHAPATPHGVPGQTLPTKPPEQPSPDPPPLTRNNDGADAQQGEGQPSLDRRRNDEDEEAGNVTLTRNGGNPGTATKSLGKRNTKAAGATATLTRSKPTAPPPPPPSGAPAAVWDHYLRALPPMHRNRRGARSQVQQGVLESPRAERIAALHDYAHSDQEREFLDYTGLPPEPGRGDRQPRTQPGKTAPGRDRGEGEGTERTPGTAAAVQGGRLTDPDLAGRSSGRRRVPGPPDAVRRGHGCPRKAQPAVAHRLRRLCRCLHQAAVRLRGRRCSSRCGTGESRRGGHPWPPAGRRPS